MKKFICMLLCAALTLTAAFSLVSCNDDWKNDAYDLSLPVLGEDGWYLVFEDNFDGTSLNEGIIFGENYEGSREIWTTSPHAIRWESNDANKPEQNVYWCPAAVSVADGNLQIKSFYSDSHVCPDGTCPSEGRFTGGIETRAVAGDQDDNKGTSDELLFAQAFGYFETRVKFPDADGLWSAFWLQSSNMRKIGAEGVDGTEIDVFESAFIKHPKKMGHALLWNGYGEFAKVDDYIVDTGTDLYDGYHTFALKWTPPLLRILYRRSADLGKYGRRRVARQRVLTPYRRDRRGRRIRSSRTAHRQVRRRRRKRVLRRLRKGMAEFLLRSIRDIGRLFRRRPGSR